MQEVFEKIIARLNRNIEYVIHENGYNLMYRNGYTDGLDHAIKVVKQETEWYNGGWIPCSERLPEDGKDVLVWYEYFRFGDYNCMYQTYGIGYVFHGFWAGDVIGQKARCIAWQPLPEPYLEVKD